MEVSPPSYSSAPLNAPAYTAAPATGGSDALPGYDGSNAPSGIFNFAPSQGIDDKLPNHFKVNEQYVKAQVLPSELQAHLVLLGAFHRLREEVRTFKGKADIPMEPAERWAVFLQRAVYRFEQWTVRMIGGEGQEEVLGEGPKLLAPNEVPPLEVVMVWHTYMLNPRTYYEDCLRKLPGLLRIGSFPLMQLAGSIDSETLLPHPPSEGRVAAFTAFTSQPFECPLNTTSDETVPVYCPNCSQPNMIPWITYKGDGFAQRGFGCICNNCRVRFSRETLGVRKFYEDMEKCIANPDRFFLAYVPLYPLHIPILLTSFPPQIPFLETPSSTTTLVLRPKFNGSLNLGFPRRDRRSKFELGVAIQNIESVESPAPVRLNIILSAYRQPGPFSLDLASAVIRQMNFVEKMVNLGFTEQARWEEDHDTLTRCVVRYHHFLDLMASTPGNFVVPTLDIDLAWHTHQLLCDSYRKLKDVIGIVRVPDHDDKVSQGALSDAYDKTSKAWKARFGVPYSICGCLPPDSSGGFGGSVISLFSKKGKSKSTLEKPFENPRPDLLSPSDEAADQTHPSDHYAVAIINPGEPNAAQAQLRRRELGKRAKELGKTVEKGKADQWGETMQKREVDHTPSFLCPVQYGVQ
ncbi:hypothetical protein M407DRAFT_85818 [Tulasnella calospora MUT 4182]|uniref:Uncharacterized protein n=1 Tax=Tulasnella calospora MUT 4182 TaxID=1051891 RepID=A0A0C3K5F1_9AGAM|nr:hypothetical protein M407DRAFT_85818 [Tulasnella calospora MUT 4182]